MPIVLEFQKLDIFDRILERILRRRRYQGGKHLVLANLDLLKGISQEGTTQDVLFKGVF